MTERSRQTDRPMLQACSLQADYSGNRALDIATIAVGYGEMVGVVGANGAGKSTLVNGLAGWSRGHPRVVGRIELEGRRIDTLPTHERVRAGLLLVPEGRLAFDRMTVEENLSTAFKPEMDSDRRVYSRDDVYALFPRLHERRRHLGAQLSGGERQMLGISRALMMGPRLLMLDEPSIGLAPNFVLQVLKTLRTLVSEGLSILLVEQNVRASIEVVDRLVLLERGRIMLEGPASEMRGDSRIAAAYLGVRAI